MKRVVLFLLSFLLVIAFSACSDEEQTYTYSVVKDDKIFEVNYVEKTIFDGTHTYQYTFSGNTDSYSITITYPNGSTYYWNHNGMVGSGSWSDDYNDAIYASGDTLCDVIVVQAPKASKASNPSKVFAAILIIAIGIFNVASPRTAWYLEYGWRYKNAEPSDTALAFNGLSGIIAIIIGIFMLFS